MAFGPELINAIARALKSEVLPGRVNRIETGDSWAAFRLSSLRDQRLIFSWGHSSCGCGLADEEKIAVLKKIRPSRSSFGEALKSSFNNSSILSVRQLDRDRILRFGIQRTVGAGFSMEMSLVFEGTDRNSNLIILDQKDEILEPAKHIHGDVNRYRTIVPGIPYTPPPPLSLRPLDETGEIGKPEDLAGLAGIGRGLSNLIEAHWETYPPKKWDEMVRRTVGDDDALILQRHGKLLTVFPVLLPGGEALDGSLLRRCGEDVLSAYFGEQRRVILARVKKGLEREIKSRGRHRDGLENQRRLSGRGPEFLKMGNLLVSAGDSVPGNVSEVSLPDWETGELLLIPLDPALSAFRNAQKYFKKYKKGKIDASALDAEIKSIDDGISELKEQLETLEYIDDPDLLAASARDVLEWVAPSKRSVNGKKKSLPPHIRLENSGDLIYIGLNARGNRHVTFKVAAPGDFWFHVHEAPGAHVILKSSGGGKNREDSLEIAASLAAWFSRVKHSGKVQVDYTERKYVRSIPGKAIAHVTYSNPRTISVSPCLWKEFPEVARSIQLEDSR